MKKITHLIYLFIFLLMVGCQVNKNLGTVPADLQLTKSATPLLETTIFPPTKIPSKTSPSASRATSQITITSQEANSSTADNSLTLAPETRLKYQCIDITSLQSGKVASDGIVVLDSRISVDGRFQPNSYLLNVATGSITQIVGEGERLTGFKVSPDRTKIVYESVVVDETDKVVQNELVVAAADGHRMKTIPWEKEWSRIVDWLDNQRVIIKLFKRQENIVNMYSTLLVMNPFSGEQQILSPEFPEIYDYSPIPDWNDWGITMYDPILTRVVYLRINEKGEYEYALWDMQNQRLLASLIYDSQIPSWSPDGSHVVLDGLPNGQEYIPGGHNSFEGFLVSREGEVEQLTNLRAKEDMYLMSYSWSPDGRHIAAWMGSPSLRKTKEVELSIVDTNTREITNYCISISYAGGYGIAFPLDPIWSPDGKQLIVMDWPEQDHRRVILVDIVKDFAVQIAEDMEPVGWMLAP